MTSSSRLYPANNGFIDIALKPWEALKKLREQRKTYATLSTLDDYLLKDIGVSRGEIERISRNSRDGRRR